MIVYIPSDSDLGRKLIDIVAPENKRTSVNTVELIKYTIKSVTVFQLKVLIC